MKVVLLTQEELSNIIQEATQQAISQFLGQQAPKEAPEFMTRTEAAKLAGVTPKTIDSWCELGKLTKYYPGGHPRLKRSELLALFNPSEA